MYKSPHNWRYAHNATFTVIPEYPAPRPLPTLFVFPDIMILCLLTFLGKSLMFSINQNLLYGRPITSDRHISDLMMYKKLSGQGKEGKIPVYGDRDIF